ncbi:helix-turn-helix domain-containing protein [Paenibacillus hamazuiensis]|uniref:helix-turn-helix domain-containing protein n=1 Tax=Paenibacillus hamazuiensis TaxID=2936508 RepID=UPI00200E832B|nr:helix-turn-helix domain-containing protein [Paenibacillus hamazuiensis]
MKRPARYYIKLVVWCFIVSSLPVILLGFFSYAKSSGIVLQKVAEEKALNLQQTQLNVEHTLKVVDQAVTHFLGSGLVGDALNEPLQPDQYQMFNELKTEMNSLQRLDSGIGDMYLISTAGNWLIHNEGLFRLDAWSAANPVVKWPDLPLPSAWVTGGDLPSPSAEDCATIVNLVKKLPLTAYKSSGMAVVQIPACRLGRLFSAGSDQEALVILDENGAGVFRTGFISEGLEPSLKRSSALFSPGSSGGFDLNVGDSRLVVTYRKSDYNGWSYFSVITADRLTAPVREIRWFTFYICLGLLIVFIVLSWYGSRRLYRPIYDIYRSVVSRQRTGTEKLVDEIQFIGEQVHALFDTKQELESKLRSHTETLRAFFMAKLFLGGMKEEEIAERLESFGMRSDFPAFCVLALQIGSLSGTRFQEKDCDLLLFSINNIVEELLPENVRLQPIVLGRFQLTVLNGSGQLDGDALAAARTIRNQIKDMLDVDVKIGISRTGARWSELPEAYEEALDSLKRGSALGEADIVRFSDLGGTEALRFSYPYALQEELFDAVKLQDKLQAEPLLERLVQEIVRGNAHPYDVQFNALRLLMNLLGLAGVFSIQLYTPIEQQSLFDQLFKLDIASEGAEWFRTKLIAPLMALIDEQSEARYLAIAKELVKIVHEEYDTDLTIESCADRLHYNPGYLSSIFKKSMGIPFSAYLAQHRHQLALRWLRETDMTIKEIAEKLRYNNPQNFIRSFKKTQGVSPGKFRELEIRQSADDGLASKGGAG